MSICGENRFEPPPCLHDQSTKQIHHKSLLRTTHNAQRTATRRISSLRFTNCELSRAVPWHPWPCMVRARQTGSTGGLHEYPQNTFQNEGVNVCTCIYIYMYICIYVYVYIYIASMYVSLFLYHYVSAYGYGIMCSLLVMLTTIPGSCPCHHVLIKDRLRIASTSIK
jgi:hypothetical protein